MVTPQEISARGIYKAYAQPDVKLTKYYLALAGWIRAEISHNRELPQGLLEKLSLTPEECEVVKGITVQEAYISVKVAVNNDRDRGYAE